MKITRYKTKKEKQIRRHRRVRARLAGTAERPRLSVFRSNNHIYAQLIDDESGKTLATASDLGDKKSKANKDNPFTKILMAEEVGKLIAEKAQDKKIKVVVFDRGGYKFMGRIKGVAEGARAGGLEF